MHRGSSIEEWLSQAKYHGTMPKNQYEGYRGEDGPGAQLFTL